MTINVSKVIYGNTIIIDLTADTVTPDKILANFTAHDKAGNKITGTCNFDVNSQDATVQVAEILSGKTAYARGTKLTGTMPNHGAVNLTIDDVNDEISIPQGYHDGGGKVSILSTEKAKLIAANIKQGITIMGVTGTLEPGYGITVHAKTVTPTTAQQIISPDEGYDYLSQVTVEAIPYVETDNSAGGKTVSIASSSTDSGSGGGSGGGATEEPT